jgi:hypothetical protein
VGSFGGSRRERQFRAKRGRSRTARFIEGSLVRRTGMGDGNAQIVLKNPSIGHSSKTGFVDAFGLVGAEEALGGATELAR